MDISYTPKPKHLFCGVSGINLNQNDILKLFGLPDKEEITDNPEGDAPLCLFHYYSKEIGVYFNAQKVISISVQNPRFLLAEKLVIGLREQDLIDMMKNSGFEKYEVDKDWGEKQVVFEEAGLTAFFDNQFVSEIFIDF